MTAMPASPRPSAADVPQSRMTGTYDFRWSRGTVIRFAFQEAADPALLDTVKLNVRRALEAWGVFPDLRPGGPALAYQLVAPPLPPGRPLQPGELAEFDRVSRKKIAALAGSDPAEGSRLQRQQDRFIAGATGATISVPDPVLLLAQGVRALDYDVLVSIAPMPIVVPANGKRGSEPLLVTYARSDLGNYARRKQFGSPTCYLGRPKGYPKLAGDVAGDLGWFSSLESRFVISHEVGHILGLAHEHQNPHRWLAWRNEDEIRRILEARFVEPVYDDFISSELTQPWRGGETFSYWRRPENPGAIELDSVMTEPVYKCLLAEREAGHECLGKSICPVEQAEFERLQRPTSFDREQLRRLYPPLPALG